MTIALEAWDRFWFRPRTGRVLGLFRIALGLVTLYCFAMLAMDLALFFGEAGVPSAATIREHAPSRPSLFLELGDAGRALAMVALFLAAGCFTVGCHTRLASILLYLLVLGFQDGNPMVLNGGDRVLRNMLFFSMLAPAGAAFSVDSLRRRLGEGGPGAHAPVLVAPWAQRMMQVQVAVIYFGTVLYKLRDDSWRSGDAMYYVFGHVEFHVRGVEQLMNLPVLCSALSYLLVGVQLVLPLLLWRPRTRWLGVALGLLLHGWIMTAMIIPVFGLVMLCSYLCFVDEGELDAAVAALRRRLGRARARLILERRCPGCRRTRRLVELLDVLGRAEVVEADGGGETGHASTRGPHLVTRDGRVLDGVAALRWLALRLPATAWLAPVLYLPLAARPACALYRRLAASRTIAVDPAPGAPCPAHLP